MFSQKITWIRFFSFLKPYIKYEFLLLILMLIGNATALVSPYFLKIIVDEVFPDKNFHLLLNLVLSIFIIYLVRILVGMWTDYLYNWISNQVLNSISLKLFNHVIRLPFSFFKESNHGDLLHRMNNEVNNVRHSLSGTIIHLVNNAITIIGLIGIMCFLQAKLFAIICLIYPLMFIFSRILNPKIKASVESLRIRESEVLGYFSERLANIKSIKLFNSYAHENKLIENRFKNLVRSNIRSGLLMSVSKSISLFLLYTIPLITLGVGGWQVLNGAMTVGTLIAFLQYSAKLNDPFQNIVALYIDLVNTSVSLVRIFELLDHPLQSGGTPYKKLSDRVNRIQLDNISFSYQANRVICNVNYTFEMGRHYAIVGSSGSGKSTIIDLLCKLYKPETGRILVNGRDLQEIGMEDWIQRISVNSQGCFLFNETILENMKYGNQDAKDHELLQVSRTINLFNDHKNYPQMFHKRIGDGGARLSGGQRQKLSLGRTMLRNSELLIIDEATSEIDSKSEDSIYSYLFRRSSTQTIILISHRLSALKYVQEIVCLENGKIVESGSISQLIQKKGHFFRLFERQLNLDGVQ